MSSAIQRVTLALRDRMRGALVPGNGDADVVYIGAPVKADVPANTRASLFLFHLEVNGELRNERRFNAPPAAGPAGGPVESIESLPLNLRYLITAFRGDGSSISTADPNELLYLGQIIQRFQSEPTLTGGLLEDQIARVTPEPYPMEEMSRIWSLFPQEVYRTSVVYLVSPVFIDVEVLPEGVRVVEADRRGGISRSRRLE